MWKDEVLEWAGDAEGGPTGADHARKLVDGLWNE